MASLTSSSSSTGTETEAAGMAARVAVDGSGGGVSCNGNGSGSGPGGGEEEEEMRRGGGLGEAQAGEKKKTKKLHGRAFYESIGSPKFVLAPMVDQSEFAWRMLSRSFIPGDRQRDLLAYTPMLHARLFCETPKFRDAHFQPLRTSLVSCGGGDGADEGEQQQEEVEGKEKKTFLDGNPADRPLFVQFCANNPDELLKAATYVAPFCDAVDLNLGCPQGIARKGRYGAFLQEDQELIYSLINKLHLGLDVPVTAKIRILDTKENTLAYAQKVLGAGASILTVHGRTREMKGHKTGLADWKMIRFLRESLPKETVLFANGNILRKEDIERCLEETGADAVMSAEGNLYDPAIFADAPPVGEEGREYWRGGDGKGGWRMDAVVRRYMDIIHRYVLEVEPPVRAPLYLPTDPDPESPTSTTTQPPAAAAESEKDHGPKRKSEQDPSTDTGPPAKRQKQQQLKQKKSGGARPPKSTSPNMLAMQPHLFKLLRPLVARHHNVRDALARSRAGDMEAFENVLRLVEVACREGIKAYHDTGGQSWEREMEDDVRLNAAKAAANARRAMLEMKGAAAVGDPAGKKGEVGVDGDGGEGGEGEGEMDESSVATVRACKRPWWVVQPYVRPLPKEALAKGALTMSKKEREALEKKGEGKGKAEEGEGEGDGDGDAKGKGPGPHVEAENVGVGEVVLVPKEGLVCG
ncbi:uncharacterized protein L3040_007305 [Drepanopeziza brunnea f. sp. 'multigermtubi']|uniref:uncharacterized protein n=1 Tax=Drepanopeziza brunnea f. sp. 'multigermtubi' TaxID=698441 RepID=UPI00238C9471|nr:hypothetical protein L3040_007305 [Drepanopeziza brunnea f. sp. 'multigermtubi']